MNPWEQEDITPSEHLILVCLFEALWCHAKYGGSISWLEDEELSEIARTIPSVAIAPWRWMDGTDFLRGAPGRSGRSSPRPGAKITPRTNGSAKLPLRVPSDA
jgi:hypothetical protein